MVAQPYNPSRASPQDYYQSSSYSYPEQAPTQSYPSFGGNYGSGRLPYSYGNNYSYNYPQQQQQQQYSSYYQDSFPHGTHPDVIRSFQMVDRDRSGFIEAKELQEALSSGYQRFDIRTIRLLIFLFKNPHDPSLRVGPKEFAALWSCLEQWRAIFDRSDTDRSGKIDSSELRNVFYSLGYTVPPSVLELLISRYASGSSRRVELNFDSFVECGMIVKGLTEKFKEKDPRYSGSATIKYDEFLSMIVPFLVSY